MKQNALVPELSVTDIHKSLRFYTDVLGFRIEYDTPEAKFAYLSLQGSQLMLEESNDSELARPLGRGMHLRLRVEAIQPLVKALKKNKHALFVAPHEKWYRASKYLLGYKQFLVQDPDGYVLRFYEDLGKRPLSKK